MGSTINNAKSPDETDHSFDGGGETSGGQSGPRVLVGIHASHTQREAMDAQRQTWIADLDADYRFVLGAPAVSEPDVISIDSPDGPIWDHGHRTPYLLRKTEALVRYALDHGYTHLFKCDDDTYINAKRLLASGFEQHDYVGLTDRHWTKETGWYRWCQGGAGYWLSRKAMTVIAEHGLRFINAEDFAVAWLLAQHGIEPHHDERYCHVSDGADPVYGWITQHKIAPAAMCVLHAAQSGGMR